MQQLAIGTLLREGAYKIERVLGQGSFGITYLAEHVHLGKKVAIKEFFMKEVNSRGDDGSLTGMTEGSLSYNYCNKFQKEAKNLSRLEHPNIVRVTDLFSENGTFYYVMDYVEGQNLNDYIKSNPVSPDEAVSIIKSVADALIYMHEQHHMLHLDLKPGNIMRKASDGHIFLIDFGLSKHYDANGQPETSTNIGLGTAGYAPIEQSNQAKSGEFRPTIDVYALGATLYKLLTGQTPPAASELVSDEDLLDDELHAKHVPENLIKVVEDAMRPSVRKRTQTVREFKANLEGNNAAEITAANTPYNDKNQGHPSTTNVSENTIVEAPSHSDNSDSQGDYSKILLARRYSELFRVSFNEALAYINSHGMSATQDKVDRAEDVLQNNEEDRSNNARENSTNNARGNENVAAEDWQVRDSFRPFSSKGRIGRLQLFLSYVAGFVAWFAVFALMADGIEYGLDNYIIVFLSFTAALFLFLYAQCAKRCHDLGKSGAWMFVPFWNVLLFFAEGESQDNQYGQGTATQSDHNGNNIMWIIFWIVVPIGLALLFGNGKAFGNVSQNNNLEAMAQSTTDWYVDSKSPANVYCIIDGQRYARTRWEVPNGQRTIHYAEDDIRESFSGTISGRECNGLLKYRDGDYFNGTISSDQIMDGHGRITDGSGTYEGDIKNGLFNGQGTYTLSDGTWMYKGNYEDGFMSGSGTEYWPKEKRKHYAGSLECNYRNGERNGIGTWYFNNHTYQKCKFKNGKQISVIEEGTWR